MFDWEHLDKIRQRLVPLTWFADAGRRGKLVVKVEGEQWYREGAEIGFEDRGNAANIVEAVRIAEVKRVIVSTFK